MVRSIGVKYKNQTISILVDDNFTFENINVQTNSTNGFYFRVKIDGVWHSLSRYIAQTPNGMYADHINGNTLDNRKSNLRNLTPWQNNINRRSKGYSYRKDKQLWRAKITIGGTFICLGHYKTEKEAKAVYQMHHAMLFPRFSPYSKRREELEKHNQSS